MSASGRTEAERARLHEMMAVGEAERSVADVRIADLKAAQEAARQRYIAVKGLVTRARKDGNAEKIATAVTRERQAYANFIAVSDASIDEMFVINGAGLERLGDLLEQVDRAWDADADAVREIEAGRSVARLRGEAFPAARSVARGGLCSGTPTASSTCGSAAATGT